MFSDKGGYYIFPNGLIMQWGTTINAYVDQRFPVSYQFPIAFPHKCLSVTLGTLNIHASNYGNADNMAQLIAFDASGFTWVAQGFSEYLSPIKSTFMAFGY